MNLARAVFRPSPPLTAEGRVDHEAVDLALREKVARRFEADVIVLPWWLSLPALFSFFVAGAALLCVLTYVHAHAQGWSDGANAMSASCHGHAR